MLLNSNYYFCSKEGCFVKDSSFSNEIDLFTPLKINSTARRLTLCLIEEKLEERKKKKNWIEGEKKKKKRSGEKILNFFGSQTFLPCFFFSYFFFNQTKNINKILSVTFFSLSPLSNGLGLRNVSIVSCRSTSIQR